MRRRRIAILGSTGSLGQQALEVVDALPHRLEVVGLAGGANLDLLTRQVMRYRPKYVWRTPTPALSETDDPFRIKMNTLGCHIVAMDEMVRQPDVDLVLVTTSGKAGLAPVFAAIRAGKMVALANKEVLVMAGDLVMHEARRHGVEILPVDSEHSAIWQCLRGENGLSLSSAHVAVSRIILTASGGAFRDRSSEQLAKVTPAEALRHPTWLMGKKITIDSATLMNKGLEVIEAHHLFGMPYESIDVVLHRESIVHSMVEFVDGSLKAQLGPPDMRLPIQYALTFPDRLPSPWPRLDLIKTKRLTFEPVDMSRYPCFQLALWAARGQGTHPAVLNAADEEAVEAFLKGSIGFLDICRVVEQVLDGHIGIQEPTLEEILDADGWARRRAREIVGKMPQRARVLH